jgi:hypothetical protein
MSRVAGAHVRHPLGQEAIPQGDAAAQGKAAPEARRQPHFVPGLFQGAHQGIGVAQEAPPGGRELRAAPAALEQHRAKPALQGLDAGADRGLGDVQALGGADEITGGGHGEKSPGEFDVHGMLCPIYR